MIKDVSERICFVSPHIYGYFSPEQGYTGGGAERQFHLLSTALTDRFDVHVVVGDFGQPKREKREGVTLHRAYPIQSRQSPLQPIRHVAILANAMRRADADVYIHRGPPRNAGIASFLTRLLRRRWVYHVAHDSYLGERADSLNYPVRRLFTNAIRNADSVIAQTAYQKEQLQKKYNKNSEVIPNGYPQSDDPPPYRDREYALWVGRLDEQQKQPHKYLSLAEALPNETFRLVGPVDEQDPYQRRIRSRAESLDNVQFVGSVPPTEIHDQYRYAKTLVNTSSKEGFPNTFLEAWRQGTPIVSLSIDPSRFGGAGSLFAADNMDRLVTIARILCIDPDFRERIGTAGKGYFEANYELSIVAKQYTQILRTVCS